MACPRCGADVPVGARFCPACGAELAAASNAEERKLVSVLFVDLVGSTARADGADPEDVRDWNQRYFDAALAAITRYGGTVEKYIGDAVMAVFGAPLARLDDAERAVRAGLAVLKGVHDLNGRHPGLDLEARAAVCTGEAIVAVDPAPGAPLATGDVVNTAARLQSAAPPGRLVVGPETFRLVRRSFALDELTPVEAKGKRDPIPAWLVGAALEAPGGRPVSTTAIVGRDVELGLLRTLWQGTTKGNHPHLVSIIGPPGIGKTRLAREFAHEIEGSGGLAVWGRSLPYEERTPYRALGQMIRHVAGIYENDANEDARRKLADAVAAEFPPEEAADTTRFLSLLLGLGLDEPADEPVHLFFAARRLFELLSRGRPLLLVLEDIHWADDALLDAAEYLVSHVQDSPIVFLALARPEFLESRPTWGTGLVGQTTLPLQPLAPDEAAAVVTSLLSAKAHPQVDRIVAAAQGNPLFLEELVAAVADDAAEQLPTTVLAAISARIDALPASARATLLHASVVGQTFWRGVLASAGEIEDLDRALEVLELRGFVQRRPQSQVLGDVEFGFKHALIRDVAYSTLPRATRRELHSAIAKTIEATSDPTSLAWILAHHWREAGDLVAARTYLVMAAERARDASAVEETNDLFTRALDLAEDEEDRRRIQLRRALALVQLEEHERARLELEAILPEMTGIDEVEALLALAEASLWTEHTERTVDLAERAVALTEANGPSELLPLALARLSQGLASRGDEGDLGLAVELGDRALAQWSPNVRSRALAEHYHLHSDAHYWYGNYQRALELARAAAETGDLDPNGAEFVLRGAGMGGVILAGLGRYEEAIAAGDVSIDTARRLGRGDNVVMNYSTLALREVFAVDDARERSATVVDRLGPSEFNMPWMNARADLIGVDLLREDVAAVEGAWPSAWEDAVGSRAWERWLISGRLAAYRAELELALGRPADAADWARRAIDLARGGQRRKYEAVAQMLLGRALSAQGLTEEARGPLVSSVTIADEIGSPLLRWRARAALAEASPAEAAARLREAGDIINAVVAGLTPPRAAAYLAAPEVVRVGELAASA